MQLEPSLVYVAGIAWVVLMAGMMLNRVGQPIVIAYLLAGILLGPSVFGLIADAHLLTPLGGMGLVLLMFFVGMGVHPTELQRTWRVGVAAVLLQITVTVACVGSIGWLLDWPIERTLLLSFAMCNSSTPVVMRMLAHKGLADGAFGSGVISVLLVQDIAIVPMLMLLSLFVGSSPGYFTLAQQLFGAGLLFVIAMSALRGHGKQTLPFLSGGLRKIIEADHELQVFAAFALCFGFAFISGALQLSTALGAFVAGVVVASARETSWFDAALGPFHVLLVGLFFLSVGTMVDIGFVWQNLGVIALLVVLIPLLITLVNALVFTLIGQPWQDGVRAGAYLGQVGEFSFVLAALAFGSGLIAETGYQIAIATVVLSLLASPLWIAAVETLLRHCGTGSDVTQPGPRADG